MNALPQSLMFRRQFLLTSSTTDRLPDWTTLPFGELTLYAHPELGVTMHTDPGTGVHFLLLGFVIDRDRPEHTDADVLARLATARAGGMWWEEFANLTGRFVLVVTDGDDVQVMHDPCGLRTVEYTFENGFHAASQAGLLAFVAPVARGEKYRQYVESDYGINVREDHLSADTTLFDGVDRLTPNHVLHATTTRQQERFWPTQAAPALVATEPVAVEALAVLRASITAAANRFPLAQPLTCGIDSRTLLAAAKPLSSKIWFYTMVYRWLSPASPDLTVPGALLRRLGQPHHILNAKQTPPQAFIDHYAANSPMAHTNDATIAYGLYRGYPTNMVAVKGNAAELIKCYYNQDGEPLTITSAEDLIDLIPRWNTVPFIVDSISAWYDRTLPVATDLGWELDLLFHWEHQLGTWQAQSQLEWDIVQDVYTPFSDRRLITAMLAATPHDRKPSNHALLERVIQLAGDELLEPPINPNPRAERVRHFVWRARTRIQRDLNTRFAKKTVRR